MTAIGWYVHHHGHGHRTRFLAVRPHLDREVIVFSSLAAPDPLPPRTRWIVLPRDDDGAVSRDVTADGLLHWAPIGHAGHRARLATIARTAAEADLAAMVVDVSAEVALFARLLGIPVVLMVLPGERTDDPHVLAHRAATRIIAAWAPGTLPETSLAAVADRVVHVGGISRFDGRAREGRPVAGSVFVLGDTPFEGAPAAWLDDPWPDLCRAEVVVSAAGQNAVADLAAVGARAVVVPQARPFGEQAATGAALAQRRLAVVTERADDVAVTAARALEPDWSVWQVAGAAARAAAVIAEVAELGGPVVERGGPDPASADAGGLDAVPDGAAVDAAPSPAEPAASDSPEAIRR